ncbi:MAG TPA: mechanosensitive ion channel family protein [Patescibacteria group bacterium]|nr:mechanosensitive ion channel family protein [Patescibacteria group bacterium]
MDFNIAIERLLNKVQGWLNGIIVMLPNFVVALIVFVLFFAAAHLIRKASFKLLQRFTHHPQVNRLITNIVMFIIIMIGLLVSLGVLNLDKTVTSLLAGAGIVGIALGFAFQDIAANFISGVFITIRHPFRHGDLIKSNDFFGTVERVRLRTTMLTLLEGQTVLIPNQQIFQKPLVNYSTGKRRVDVTVGVSYGDDLEKVKRVTIEAIEKLSYIRQDHEVELFFSEFSDSSINFDVRFWIDFKKQQDYLKARSEAIMNIKAAYDANDITIPFPIRTLDFGIKGGEKLSEVLKLQNGENGQNMQEN